MPRSGKTTLAWQAGIILLPIVVLAGLGAFYLRQDRILVRHEAEQRARALAEEIVRKTWENLTSRAGTTGEHAFCVNNEGRLLFPAPLEITPTPRPLDLEKLTPEQAELWGQVPDGSILLTRFLDTELPPEFEAAALFQLGLELAAENQLTDAVIAFRTVYQKFPRSVGETGLPLAPLAGLKSLELGPQRGTQTWAHPLSWDILCRDAIAQPTAVSALVLDRATELLGPAQTAEHHAQWQAHENLRRLYRASRDQLTAGTPPLFWIRAGTDRWLASRVTENATNQWIVARAVESRIETRETVNSTPAGLRSSNEFRNVNAVASIYGPPEAGRLSLAFANVSVPDYFGISIEAAGEPFLALNIASARPSDSSSRSSRPKPLANEVLATARHVENGRELLAVSVHLISPQSLYAQPGRRAMWFGILIAASTIAAVTALFSLWRSVERQQRLAEAKDNFVSSVSHELRAPIASVRLMAEGLERGTVTEPQKQREYFHFIVRECQRLSALIQNVLDFSRIDQGRKQYDFELADASRLVEETVKSMEPPAAERNVRLRVTSAQPPIQALIDARALQQTLVNLIDNAVKHSPPESEIEIGVQNVGGVLTFWVEDHGEGIPASEHVKIFERFYRVGSELRRKTPGAGIGLSIVKHIAEAHGGCVRVQSRLGKGSRFTIEIPLKQ
ncbi:MAG: HAMP domain-containing histidine kinase [Verrucomicrobia subdivision 3 bacterium]|nr:HAMP domain-containing histidine kinase [Limisphaerales bacterium]